jgi:putative tricarboxylic transport membrane protein
VRISDRVFGLLVIIGALAYMASALMLKTSFLSDPVGMKTFPLLLGGIAALCGLFMMIRPDADPDWPDLPTLGLIALAVVVLVLYALSLKRFGFLIPTALAAAILSYQITPRAGLSVATGLGLSVVLFLIFKYVFGLGLVPWPKALTG